MRVCLKHSSLVYRTHVSPSLCITNPCVPLPYSTCQWNISLFCLLQRACGTPHSPVKCYADNRRHRDACLFPLRQLGDDEDQDGGDDDDDAQRQQLIPTPAETVASRRAGPLWNCLKGKTNQRASTVTADVVHQHKAILSVAF